MRKAFPSQLHGGEQFSPNSATRVRGSHDLAGKTPQFAWPGRPVPPPPRQTKDLQVFVPGPTKEAIPSPGPWAPCPPRITNCNGAGMIASTQSAPVHSWVSPPAPQLQESEGLSSRPSQGVGQAFITVATKADMGALGGRNRRSGPIFPDSAFFPNVI